MDGHPTEGSAVRVWLRADDNPDRVGHLAQIAKSHPEKGMHAKLVTTAVANAHWLPMDEKGFLWDWLRNLSVRHPRIPRMCTCASAVGEPTPAQSLDTLAGESHLPGGKRGRRD